MSETWTTKCPECKGHRRLPITPSGCLPHDHDRACPACHDGNVAIGVCVPSTHDGGTGYYRPLTTLEVEAIFEKHNNPNDNLKTKVRLSRKQTMHLIIIGVENGMITYKGQPCKLIPFKEVIK